MMLRIYADYQNLEDENRLILDCLGTADDLARFGTSLSEGMTCIFYTDDGDEKGQPDDLLVDGVIHLD
jgi:hypothetical protein